MGETIESVAKWADETFGPTRPVDALDRAFVEIDELKAKYDPNCIFPYRTDEELVEEAADVCITLYRYIYLVDKEAINKKMAVNRKRKWKLDGGGNGQHIKEGGVEGNGHTKEGG